MLRFSHYLNSYYITLMLHRNLNTRFKTAKKNTHTETESKIGKIGKKGNKNILHFKYLYVEYEQKTNKINKYYQFEIRNMFMQ